MPTKVPQKQIYVLNMMYIVLFFAASFITSLLTAINFQLMIIFTIVVIIYWFLAIIITGLYQRSISLKQILFKTAGSLIVIMAISIVIQLLLIKVPFAASFLFFAISLTLLLLLHFVFFKSTFTR